MVRHRENPTTETNKNHQFEIAKRLWDDYHSRTAAFAKQLQKEIEELRVCFGIEHETMENARKTSREIMNATTGGII
jgi:xanthine dehydrogenase iron-sulfur cluster and FAD-binding subunit A